MAVFQKFFRIFLAIVLPLLLGVNLIIATELSETIIADLTGGVMPPIDDINKTYFGFESIMNALRDMPKFQPITTIINSIYAPFGKIVNDIKQLSELSLDFDVLNTVVHVLLLPIDALMYSIIALLEIFGEILNVGIWLANIFRGVYNSKMPIDPYANWYNTNLI